MKDTANAVKDTPNPEVVSTVLLVSLDAVATRKLTEAMKQFALSVEVCVGVPAAMDRVGHRKFEAVVIDFSLGYQAAALLEHVRASASNRTAVTFALTGSSEDTALARKAGCSFTLERPLRPDSISRTFRAAYGLIVRERRRYFRFPIEVPAVLASREATPDVYCRTVDISERGVALSGVTPLKPGAEAVVQFTLPDLPRPIAAKSRVCWTNARGQIGLCFLPLRSDLASDLQAWLARRLEEQLPDRLTQTLG